MVEFKLLQSEGSGLIDKAMISLWQAFQGTGM